MSQTDCCFSYDSEFYCFFFNFFGFCLYVLDTVGSIFGGIFFLCRKNEKKDKWSISFHTLLPVSQGLYVASTVLGLFCHNALKQSPTTTILIKFGSYAFMLCVIVYVLYYCFISEPDDTCQKIIGILILIFFVVILVPLDVVIYKLDHNRDVYKYLQLGEFIYRTVLNSVVIVVVVISWIKQSNGITRKYHGTQSMIDLKRQLNIQNCWLIGLFSVRFVSRILVAVLDFVDSGDFDNGWYILRGIIYFGYHVLGDVPMVWVMLIYFFKRNAPAGNSSYEENAPILGEHESVHDSL